VGLSRWVLLTKLKRRENAFGLDGRVLIELHRKFSTRGFAAGLRMLGIP
jgi:hypothetical protein